MGQWKKWQSENIPERVVRESFASGDNNLFIITGAVSRLTVLDCDNEAAEKYWRERLGEALDQTSRVATSQGHHYYFRLAEGQAERGRSSGDSEVKWDLRAEGGGVIAPPSVHKSGRIYTWEEGHGPEAIQDAPKALFERGEGEEEEDNSRSVLTHLLTHPPAEGGRNVWLAKVAGHYARHIPFQDAFEHLVREAAEKLTPPLPEDEITKMLKSIWSAERAKGVSAPEVKDEEDESWRADLVQPAEETGWLVSGRTHILTQIREKKESGWELGLARWMDSDVRVTGVIETEADRTYEVRLLLRDGETVDAALPASTVADPRRLSTWLAAYGISIGTPDQIWPAKMKDTVRLTRYLEAQGAQALEAAPALGWHKETDSFITHEGLIRAGGAAPFERVRPDPQIKQWAPYRYGHRGKKEAQDVLKQVLTFHDEVVTSVFGSWWAACLLKPQVQTVSSQFPFMALEAASESGKTTGFFSLMLQLSGAAGGHSNPTRAALRDYLSAHNSGIVWLDDLDSLEEHGELLRNVTVGGAMVKKGQDNHDQVVAVMRGALVVSGEALGLEGQKALLDRAILLEVPSPIGRESVETPGRPQWDDILELKKSYPDLTDFAGSVVEMALSQEARVSEFKDLRPGAGRFADKLAVLRLGARILTAMLGEDLGIVERVDKWVEGQEDQGSENTLTMRLLPLALGRTGWKSRPEGPDTTRRMTATPCFVVDDGTIWFSPGLLADWWEREPPGGKRVDPRVESKSALEQQARALGMGGLEGKDRKRFRFVTGEGKTVYWRVPLELSLAINDRSRGYQEGEDDNGENQIGKLL